MTRAAWPAICAALACMGAIAMTNLVLALIRPTWPGVQAAIATVAALAYLGAILATQLSDKPAQQKARTFHRLALSMLCAILLGTAVATRM